MAYSPNSTFAAVVEAFGRVDTAIGDTLVIDRGYAVF
jgi:hypothetical protein